MIDFVEGSFSYLVSYVIEKWINTTNLTKVEKSLY